MNLESVTAWRAATPKVADRPARGWPPEGVEREGKPAATPMKMPKILVNFTQNFGYLYQKTKKRKEERTEKRKGREKEKEERNKRKKEKNKERKRKDKKRRKKLFVYSISTKVCYIWCFNIVWLLFLPLMHRKNLQVRRGKFNFLGFLKKLILIVKTKTKLMFFFNSKKNKSFFCKFRFQNYFRGSLPVSVFRVTFRLFGQERLNIHFGFPDFLENKGV